MKREFEATHESLPIGTPYDGSVIAEVVDYDPTDDDQPFLYLLADGRTVWIDVAALQA